VRSDSARGHSHPAVSTASFVEDQPYANAHFQNDSIIRGRYTASDPDVLVVSAPDDTLIWAAIAEWAALQDNSEPATGTYSIQLPPTQACKASLPTAHAQDLRPQCFEHGCNGRRFSCNENYRRHIREKGMTRGFVCDHCQRRFTRRSHLSAHISAFRCKVLKFAFFQDLNEARRSGEADTASRGASQAQQAMW
jgi:hypothetical protein